MNLLRGLPLFNWHRIKGIAFHLPQVTDPAERQRLVTEIRNTLGALRERFVPVTRPSGDMLTDMLPSGS